MADPAVVAAVLAHQGGWDEILLVGVPIVVIAGLLAVVKRRVDAALPVSAEPDTEARDDPGPDDAEHVETG